MCHGRLIRGSAALLHPAGLAFVTLVCSRWVVVPVVVVLPCCCCCCWRCLSASPTLLTCALTLLCSRVTCDPTAPSLRRFPFVATTWGPCPKLADRSPLTLINLFSFPRLSVRKTDVLRGCPAPRLAARLLLGLLLLLLCCRSPGLLQFVGTTPTISSSTFFEFRSPFRAVAAAAPVFLANSPLGFPASHDPGNTFALGSVPRPAPLGQNHRRCASDFSHGSAVIVCLTSSHRITSCSLYSDIDLELGTHRFATSVTDSFHRTAQLNSLCDAVYRPIQLDQPQPNQSWR